MATLPGLPIRTHSETPRHALARAHRRQVPADAKVVSGPGLITGGPPVKLESSDAAVASFAPVVCWGTANPMTTSDRVGK